MTSGNEVVRVLRAADRPAAVWKNGGGVTREIAAWPEGAGMSDFAWRVSLAEVAADGPFSAFPGVDRTLTLAEGSGMDLAVAGVHRVVDERYAPQDFPGDRPTDCRLLHGPVVNFNVMYRRDATEADTAVVRGALAVTVPPGETLLVVALEGPAVLDRTGGPDSPVQLAPHDAALATGGLTCRVRTPGRAAVVTFRPRPR
ncbi:MULTISPECIES: HutD family protein [unclassified Streptomyces]|uniref:HutD/Ves family protein n=1 Tax=unclassified Streptomyces TaxID=2593676 RepID=UPI001BE6F04B|nr:MULTISPECIES: HutD family protein [unclassified Streptomyces]MBT2406131.1 HutD family protein [Streptomyces sp. ISL-21]MBT2458702.1 HutD family protein [Streptomyces sp. ISL-86]MBT2609189.1 HutD family protein [Streptomyces sp. ISL-87]